jgi:predicted enzyme related to lactoylglutathione lyase
MHRFALTGGLAVVAGLASGQVGAHDFCVATATQLANAFEQSSTGGTYANEANAIHIRTGTYATGTATSGNPFTYHGAGTHALTIFGGYNAGCTSRTTDARTTVLDGLHASQVLFMGSQGGPITLIGLSVVNGEGGGNNSGAGAGINMNSDEDGNVSVQDVIFAHNHSPTYGGGLAASVQQGTLSVKANLFHDNSADLSGGAAELNAGAGAAVVWNNTVTQNTTPAAAGAGGMIFHGTSACECVLANNIFWANSNFGLYLSSSAADLEYNDIGTLGGLAPATEVGTVSMTPYFVDPASNDFHLSSASPLLGATPLTPTATDLDGHVFGAASHSLGDLGAYYDTIFANHFD